MSIKELSVIDLTNVSNGTLLTCCRRSKSFADISSECEDIEKVRKKWRAFLSAQSDRLLIRCNDWQDAWSIFIKYKDANMKRVSNAR